MLLVRVSYPHWDTGIRMKIHQQKHWKSKLLTKTLDARRRNDGAIFPFSTFVIERLFRFVSTCQDNFDIGLPLLNRRSRATSAFSFRGLSMFRAHPQGEPQPSGPPRFSASSGQPWPKREAHSMRPSIGLCTGPSSFQLESIAARTRAGACMSVCELYACH